MPATGQTENTALPYVDEHVIEVDASPEQTWTAVKDQAGRLGFGEANLFARVLGTNPRRGFEIAHIIPGRRLALTGQHRFARYELAFELSDRGNGTAELRALTYAAFPGPHGTAYRLLVISSGAHAIATNRILRAIRDRATRVSPAA